MTIFFVQLLPLAFFALSLTVPICVGLWIRHQRKHRRNPLTYQMFRNPGESINGRIEQLNDEIQDYLAFTGIVPLFFYSAYLSTRYFTDTKISPWSYCALTVIFVGHFGYRLSKAIKQRHNEQLGLDCERAVGQELNQLMLEGCHVFHDFQADKFNIDHIVVAENGVFAIETKGRAKPDRGKGQADARVTYDGDYLQFPHWREQDPLEQAKRQASWLSQWLSSAVGDQIAVRPVLALPGWFIDRKKPYPIIYNGKTPQFLTKIRTEAQFSQEMIQRISHQLEQKCRNVAPQAYKKKE
ncbi:nuclease-related domain-containing protein [Geomonas propionica]|uniref:NERD domain-containing protein n=1 Tax=Geomonas propionica TaxID=2798582 RepID=A0ABS0YYY3_9BACT|nr:nuclease-related domain-containing protein [Geomonas propionica]MBJ6802717.1 NERD domain-containing protein [Geomonas propionica]